MPKRLATVVLVAALATTASACTGSTAALKQTDLSKKLQDTGKLNKAFAGCVANELFTSKDRKVVLSTKEKKDFNSATLSDAVQKSLVAKSTAAGKSCSDKGLKP